MAATINASTSAGVVTTADTSGNLDLQSNGTTIIGYTSAGAAVTGTLSSSGQTILGSSSGNVGVGVTPSAWSVGKAVELGYSGTALFPTGSTDINLGQNAYYNGGFKYGQTGVASGRYVIDTGVHYWQYAASGTAGGAITWTTGVTLDIYQQLTVKSSASAFIWNWTNGNSMLYNNSNGPGTVPNSAAAVLLLRADSANARSINAGGSINASGADYAEYMTKCGDFNIAKGGICGVTLKGELTNVFADAISFMVKSTNPSYVGGDTWGGEDAVGERPKRLDEESDDQFFARKAPFEKALETARQKVDRVAFSGQVPVNVIGATAGQYIIPVNDNGAIGGQAISNPTFEQYQSAVGKVIAIEPDGRAKIIVKVA